MISRIYPVCYFGLVLLLSSCNSDDDPFINLPPKPENLKAYLNVTVGDKAYDYFEGVDSLIFAQSYRVAAEGYDRISEYGASPWIDADTIDFSIFYAHQRSTRAKLIHGLITENQQLSFGYSDPSGSGFVFEKLGFSLKMSEYHEDLGYGSGYSSTRTEQPATSFFKIHNYYEGYGKYTVWLEGSFQVAIKTGNGIEEAKGNFFMEFPVCCYDD